MIFSVSSGELKFDRIKRILRSNINGDTDIDFNIVLIVMPV
ncbi:hypothetical protein CRENPOLYSF1_430028 [Crenothrix polyspora]|uniref:Uncharacterized protein n=1 Tax=Crenothrix polyspora TaxID=360316 RepID=A0A1R4HAM7_9GAMM|nr:hypothetical protein CRENPOLYSF1_430028 [Crenothrix polyspora]